MDDVVLDKDAVELVVMEVREEELVVAVLRFVDVDIEDVEVGK